MEAVTTGDFSLKALYEALDEQRRFRELTWAAVTREINQFAATGHPISSSTITGTATKRVVEGDGVLQMLLWLDRSPESFVPGIVDAGAERFRLPRATPDQILRWNTRALYAAMNEKREVRAMTWADVAQEIDGFAPGTVKTLADGGRTWVPHAMRLVRWLGEPAATFAHLVPRARF